MVFIIYFSRPPILNGYGSSSSHEVKAEDLSANDTQDIKPNIYALKNEIQASDYSNKGTYGTGIKKNYQILIRASQYVIA